MKATRITFIYILLSCISIQTKSFQQTINEYSNKSSLGIIIFFGAGLKTFDNINKMNDQNISQEKRKVYKQKAVLSTIITLGSSLYALANYRAAYIINWYTLSPMQTD